MIGKRSLLLAIALMSIADTAAAEMNIVKDFRYPILRTSILNPQSLPNPCVRREYRVLHRRDAEGRPYDLKVAPIRDAEMELIPSVIEAFYRWRFKVPIDDDWRAGKLLTDCYWPKADAHWIDCSVQKNNKKELR